MSSGSLSAAASSTVEDDHHLHHELALAAADINGVSDQDCKDQAFLGQLFASFHIFFLFPFKIEIKAYRNVYKKEPFC